RSRAGPVARRSPRGQLPQLLARERLDLAALPAAVVPAALLFGLQLPVVRASLLRHRRGVAVGPVYAGAGLAFGQPSFGTGPPSLHGAGVDGQVGGQVATPQANVRTAPSAAAAIAITSEHGGG